MRASQLVESLFTTAPLSTTSWGFNNVHNPPHEDEEQVPIYYSMSRNEMVRKLTEHGGLRALVTDDNVYCAPSRKATHLGILTVLRSYGVNVENSWRPLIVQPKYIYLDFGGGKVPPEAKWRATRQYLLNHPRMKIMFPDGFVLKNEWT